MMDWFGNQAWPDIDYDLRMGLGGAMLFVNNGRVMANLIYSGLLDRYEKLTFVSVESGLGWIPFTLEALDMDYLEVGIQAGKLKRMPSEYYATNFLSCFWFERRDLSQTIKRLGNICSQRNISDIKTISGVNFMIGITDINWDSSNQ